MLAVPAVQTRGTEAVSGAGVSPEAKKPNLTGEDQGAVTPPGVSSADPHTMVRRRLLFSDPEATSTETTGLTALMGGIQQIVDTQRAQLESQSAIIAALQSCTPVAEPPVVTSRVRDPRAPSFDHLFEADGGDDEMKEESEEVKLVIAEINKTRKLPPRIVSKLNSCAAKFRTKSAAFFRSEAHCLKLKERIATLSEGRIPAGMAQHSLLYQTEIWQEAVDSLSSELGLLEVTVLSSFEHARKSAHLQYLKRIAAIDFAVESKRLSELKDACTLESFTKQCLAIVAEEFEHVTRVSKLFKAPLGLYHPLDDQATLYAAKL